jgi:parvulin-like peptidyl-prolyl isomerase
MKVWFGALVLFFLAGMTTGTTASAIEPPQAVASQGTSTTAPSEGPQLMVRAPIFSPLFDSVPLAVVNDDPVTMGDLTNALTESHEERDPAKTLSGGKIDFAKILDRLINVRLVVQEAVRIGFDELPEFKASVEDFSTQALAKLLMREVTKDIKADPVEVEKQYKDSVVEWKIKSVFFEKEDDAKSMEDGIKAGKSYDELAEKAVAEEKVKGVHEGSFMKPKDLAPPIQEAVATMETGSVSPIIKVQDGKTTGFTILKLEEKRYPESPEMRDQTQWSVLGQQRTIAWEKFKTELVKKYVKINDRTLGKLNYEASLDKWEKLLEDARVVAEIKGDKPVTVGELTEELQKKFWHGVEEAAKAKKLNKQIRPSLFSLLGTRLIAKEVSDRGLAKNEEFQKELREYKDSTLFGLFIQRAVFPDVKVTDDDLKAYYEKHKQEYQYPEMMKMSSVAFGNKRNAEAALVMLRKGTDMAWVRNNAEGVIAGSEDDPLSKMNGGILSVNSLPGDMVRIVTGAHAGEYRLYEGTESGRFYVLSVEDAIPARQQPFEEVKEQFRQKVFQEKFNQAMEEWFHKLRSASKVKVYLSEAGK